jgi:hypothetical protein
LGRDAFNFVEAWQALGMIATRAALVLTERALGRSQNPASPTVRERIFMTTIENAEVVLLYKRNSEPDEQLVGFIEAQLTEKGHRVFIDRHLTMGMDWAREIENRIRSAAAIIPLLSADSIYSEMLGFEIESAHEASQLRAGCPRFLPVRLNYTGPLPEPLASILDPLQYFLWEGEQDTLGLVTELAEALKQVPQPGQQQEPDLAAAQNVKAAQAVAAENQPTRPPTRLPALEAVGGAVPLDSEFYITRSADGDLARWAKPRCWRGGCSLRGSRVVAQWRRTCKSSMPRILRP